MDFAVEDLDFERYGLLRRLVKAAAVNPVANYFPAGLLKGVLRFTKSELAAANWANPGGWRSMVISYEGRPRKLADRVLVAGGTIPTALRNRRRLAARVLARLIDATEGESAHVLCLGAGPGQIITDAMLQARRRSHATLVDINNDAFEYGRQLAERRGLTDRVRFVQGDVRNGLAHMLHDPPHIVKMLGICEYLTDQQILDIVSAAAAVMAPGTWIVFNSLSKTHGTDRFFRRVFGLHMNHRPPEALQGLMARGGFGDFISLREPLGVYHVIAGRKRPG